MDILTASTIVIEAENGIPGGFTLGIIALIFGIIGVIATLITLVFFFEEYGMSKRSASTFISCAVLAIAIITTGGILLGKQSAHEHSLENKIIEVMNKKYDMNIINTKSLYSGTQNNSRAYFGYINEDKFYEEYLQITTIKKDTDMGTKYTLNFFSVTTDKNGYLVNGGETKTFKPCTHETCKKGERQDK